MISPSRRMSGASRQDKLPLWLVLIAGTFVLAAAYYYWGDVAIFPAPEAWHSFLGSLAHHEIGFILLAVPVVLAAVRFYEQGAIVVAAAATLTIVPHAVLYTSSPDPGFRVVSFAAITFLLGVLVGSLLRRRELLIQHQADLEHFISGSLQAQEAEKQYLARELHDETAQQLVDVVHRIDEVQDAAADEATAARIQGLRASVEDVLDGTRRFMQGLRPPQLDELGLVPSLRWMCEEAEGDTGSNGMRFEVRVDEPLPQLSKGSELAVYRIAQEAMTNARRHSDAEHVTLSVSAVDHKLRLTVADDGHGFETKPLGEMARQGKFGLIGLAERARLAGGTTKIESAPGRGTQVTLEVPAAS